MIKTKSVVITAILLATSLAVGALMVVTFGNIQVRSTHTYKADFAQVSGLKNGSEVRAAGVTVGKVTGLLLRKSDDHIVVTFTVDKSIPLMTNTQATVKYKDLLDNRFLDIAQGTGPAAPLEPAAMLPASDTHPALDLDELYNGFQPLFDAITPTQVNALAASLIDVFQGQSGTIDSLLSRVGSLTGTLADSDKVIGQLITNLNSVLGTVNAHGAQTSTLIVRLQQLVTGLNDNRTQIAGSFSQVSDLSSAIGGLLSQARAPLTYDVDQLGAVSKNINADSSDLDAYLSDLPLAYRVANRQGLYGSTFNFYLCGVQILTDVTPNPPLIRSSANRCQENATGAPK